MSWALDGGRPPPAMPGDEGRPNLSAPKLPGEFAWQRFTFVRLPISLLIATVVVVVLGLVFGTCNMPF